MGSGDCGRRSSSHRRRWPSSREETRTGARGRAPGTECSCRRPAPDNRGILLTGDAPLRRVTTLEGRRVHDVLWGVDEPAVAGACATKLPIAALRERRSDTTALLAGHEISNRLLPSAARLSSGASSQPLHAGLIMKTAAVSVGVRLRGRGHAANPGAAASLVHPLARLGSRSARSANKPRHLPPDADLSRETIRLQGADSVSALGREARLLPYESRRSLESCPIPNH